MITDQVIIRKLGIVPYIQAWNSMKTFTISRTSTTVDEIWCLEHPPVFTQGQNGKPEHILRVLDTPVIPIDRGGQITYHGPGQLVVYTLIDVLRKKLKVRELVTQLERSIVNLLADYDLKAETECKAPGVYIDGHKICSIGLRIKKGCAYHGLALNVNMDLNPFFMDQSLRICESQNDPAG